MYLIYYYNCVQLLNRHFRQFGIFEIKHELTVFKRYGIYVAYVIDHVVLNSSSVPNFFDGINIIFNEMPVLKCGMKRT